MSDRNDYSALSREQLIERLQELTRTEDLLRQSEAQLAGVLRAAPAGIGVLRDRVLLEVNPAMTTITGYDREELIGMPARTLYPGDTDYDYVGTEKYRLMREQGVGRVVTRWRRKDGRVVDVCLSSTPLMADDPGGQIVFTVEDISERKRAEAALLQSEELTRSTLQALPAHIAVIGCDGRIIAVNQSWVDFARSNDAGDLPQVTVGANYLGIVRQAANMDDPDAVRAAAGIEQVLNGALPQFAMEYPCHSPSKQRWFLMSVVPLSASAGSGLVISHLDVTERRLAEEALRESEERYRSVVEDQTEVISRFLPDGTFLFVNEVYCRVFGKTAAELVGSRWQPAAYPDDLPMVEASLRTLAPDNPVVVIENRIRTGSGELRWMQFVNRALFDGTGRIAAIQAVGRDITERRQAEEAVARQRDALVREVHHRIKNHLQGVTGLLREQACEHPEIAGILGDAIRQIRAIGEVYGLQSRRADACVCMGDIVRMTVADVPGNVPVVCHFHALAQVVIEQSEAVPLALVLNELITNAIKHLAPPDAKRPVRLFLERGDAGRVRVVLRSGPAYLPSGFDFPERQSLGTGLELVHSLLPPQGASLRYRQEGDEVVTALTLEPPIILPFEA